MDKILILLTLTLTIIIKFDKDNKVKDFSYRTSSF